MCDRVYRGANHCSLDFFAHSATGRLLVSTILRLFGCHRIGMYSWFVDDEKMGCLYLHRLCSPKSGCSSCNGCLEHHGPSDTRSSHIFRIEECFKNDMTKFPNKARSGRGQAAQLSLVASLRREKMKISQGIMSVEVEEFIDVILEKKRYEFLIERGFLKEENTPLASLSQNYTLQETLWTPEIVKETTDYFNRLKLNVKNWFKLEVNETLEKKEAPGVNDVNELKKEGLIGANNDITKKGEDAVVRRIDEFISVKVKTT